jgi:hypothetical protein
MKGPFLLSLCMLCILPYLLTIGVLGLQHGVFSSNRRLHVGGNLMSWNTHDSNSYAPEDTTTTTESETRVPLLVFGGGGIYFYWQIGITSYLRQQKYDLSPSSFAGASSGALAATLSATNVDAAEATALALDMAEAAGVWKRGSLQGVWGDLIYEWLDCLIPPDALEYVSNDRVRALFFV